MVIGMSHRVKFLQGIVRRKKEPREPKVEEPLDPAKFPPNDGVRPDVEGLTPNQLLWYRWLDANDLKQLEDGYFNKVHGRRGPIGNVTFASYVKICAAIAVRMHSKQNRMEKRNIERLAKMGKRNLGDKHGPDDDIR
jgi:hypothetical protein